MHSDRRGSLRESSPGVWRLRWDLSPGPDGKRRARSKTIRGTKADARRALNAILREIDLGLAADPGAVTVATYLAEWLAHVKARRRPATAATYRTLLTKHVLPRLGTIRLRDLSPAHVTSLY